MSYFSNFLSLQFGKLLNVLKGQSIANRNQMKQKAQDPIALQKEQQSRIVAPPAIETPTSKSIFNLEVPRQLVELHLVISAFSRKFLYLLCLCFVLNVLVICCDSAFLI